jgi:hypothetical protein
MSNTWIALMVVFAVIDMIAYSKAKFPERTRPIYKLPGGGLIAYFRLGRDRNDGAA